MITSILLSSILAFTPTQDPNPLSQQTVIATKVNPDANSVTVMLASGRQMTVGVGDPANLCEGCSAGISINHLWSQNGAGQPATENPEWEPIVDIIEANTSDGPSQCAVETLLFDEIITEICTNNGPGCSIRFDVRVDPSKFGWSRTPVLRYLDWNGNWVVAGGNFDVFRSVQCGASDTMIVELAVYGTLIPTLNHLARYEIKYECSDCEKKDL